MSHLWKREADGAWAVVPLADRTYHLTQGLPASPADAPADSVTPSGVRLVCVPGSDRNPRWALLAAPSARVTINDQPLALGLRVLRDKDKIRLGSRLSVYFSAERLAVPEAFPGLPRTVTCPRCQQPINEGDRAVCCPQCATWVHYTEPLPCWPYATTCPACDQRTDAGDSYSWSPALL
jgi:hypothetical protein